MRMIIGGAFQGKLRYALGETGFSTDQVTRGDSCPLMGLGKVLLLDGLHILIRRWLEAGEDPMVRGLALLKENPHVIIVTDEIGCGVVPLDRGQRDWREAVGRVCCQLAHQAERVDRVFCGVPVCIKGGHEEG